MIPRDLSEAARRSRAGYPAVLVTGPRQSGKTTFARAVFDDLPYVNLESPIERAELRADPVGFLARFPNGAIFDEFQNVPELLSHLQVRIDEERAMGRWLLTGSQQIETVRGATQSLAGRIAILDLLPFSLDELETSDRKPRSKEEAILRGGYPPLYDEDRDLDPVDWLESYLATFVQRDVRPVVGPRNPHAFDRFLRLCATRTGQELNLSRLGAECEIDRKTVGHWLGALEACYVIRLLRPHRKNFGKRPTKQPRLHFLDTGLACRLLHITDVQQLGSHPLLGPLFETWCFTELAKHLAHRSRNGTLWFWRSSDGHQVDFLIERGRTLVPIEIKVSSTPSTMEAAGIVKLQELNVSDDSVEVSNGLFIYGGREHRPGSRVEHVPWDGIGKAMDSLG